MNSDSKSQNKNNKRTEKLDALRKKRAEAESKTKDISAQIAKIEKEIHADDIRRLEKICETKNISFSELIDFIEMLSDEIKLSDIAEMLDSNSSPTKNTAHETVRTGDTTDE